MRTVTSVRRHANLSPIFVGTFNARSIHSKFTSITQWICNRRLHVAGVVETWHDSHDDPDLVICCPAGYAYVDKSRPRSGTLATNSCTNHGGVVLLYRTQYKAREVTLPDYKSFEYVSVFLQCSSFSALTVAIYRPGSTPASECFFDELSDVLERVSTFSNLIIIDDTNLHLDSATDAHTDKFQHLLAIHNLRQHVSKSTHQHGHTLDVIITRDEQKVESISVDPPTDAVWSFNGRRYTHSPHSTQPRRCSLCTLLMPAT